MFGSGSLGARHPDGLNVHEGLRGGYQQYCPNLTGGVIGIDRHWLRQGVLWSLFLHRE